MFDKLFDLPAHPLLIHAPLVLLPVAAIVTIVLAAKSSWRERSGWWPLAGLFIVTVMLFAAKESGEAFNEGFDIAFGGAGAERHAELGDTTFLITLVWLVVLAGLTAIEQVERLRTGTLQVIGSNLVARQVIAGLTSVVAIVATVWLIRTGHEGARITWGPVTPQLFPEG